MELHGATRSSGTSGGISTVTDGVTTVTSAVTLTIVGGSVTNSGGGNATVTFTGSGAPGGLNTQVQYNNVGAFAGITGATTNGTIMSLTNPLIGGATLTTSTVNGVTLTTGGATTSFLNASGAYSTPAGSGSGTVTSIIAGTGLTGGTITTTGTIALDVTSVNTWTGAQIISTVPFTISGNQSNASWTTNGTQLSIAAATLNDSTSTGTVAHEAANAIGIPTITATSATTFTNYSTLYIAGPPVNSTNATITNKWALFVASGNVSMAGTLNVSSTVVTGTLLSSGNFQVGGSTSSANLFASVNNAINAVNPNAGWQFGGSTNVSFRTMLGTITSNVAVGSNDSYATNMFSASPVTINNATTSAWLTTAVFQPLGTVTKTGTGAVTNTATLYINGASAAGTTANYSLYVASGDTQLNNGNLILGTAGNKINITTGTNASVGKATLSGGTVTVSTTAVTASSLIFLTDATTGALTNIGTPTVGTIVAGTSFVINSSNPLDTSNINWLIIN